MRQSSFLRRHKRFSDGNSREYPYAERLFSVCALDTGAGMRAIRSLIRVGNDGTTFLSLVPSRDDETSAHIRACVRAHERACLRALVFRLRARHGSRERTQE